MREEFKEFIENFQKFESSIERIENALGNYCCLFEADFYEAVGKMFDIFMEAYFTDAGRDLISAWVFEDGWNKTIYFKRKPDLFDKEEREEEIVLETLDDLWNYMESNKETYIK